MTIFENTPLWKKTLGLEDETYQEEIEELKLAFLKFRKNSSFLVSAISKALPQLTQHDTTHLDSLWDTASIICGNDFPINPLEGFILGGAILIHDSALCFEAYKDGQDGIRQTPQWQDSYVDLCEKYPNENDESIKHQADFNTLRELHAIQAESLLSLSWSDPDTKQQWFLLENQNLRKHFGKLIGTIAASHHWDIEDLEYKLAGQQNTLPNYPREWRIDPIKIACILRCADAAHIDNLRAPDFLHALIKRNGIAFDHWQAQNKIAKVDIDQSDNNEESLLYTSTTDFEEKDANSWFVVYDALKVIDKEIKSSNSLLKRLNSFNFKIKKVSGIESPEILKKYIRVDGWSPCSAQVHVGNIERLVENLGGQMLYGKSSDLLGVVLRELIQNSRDSILARYQFDTNFEGKISIELQQIEGDYFITIEDNGIGMSERVLTGPLLDFGTSFWSSSLVKSEFPGLRSSKFKSVGKFGIGFYSIFMIAQQVYVASKNWNQGLSDINLLKFLNGFSLRPILKKGQLDNFHPSTSTQVKFKLKKDFLNESKLIEIKTNTMGSSNFQVPIQKYISALCGGLDVNVFFKDSTSSNEETKIHNNIADPSFDKLKWIENISFVDFNEQVQNETKSLIKNHIKRLKPIDENNISLGIAAISIAGPTKQNFLSLQTVGGLAHSVHTRSSDNFIGFFDYHPKSAKREVDNFVAEKSKISNWAKDQLEEIRTENLNDLERYFASSSLAFFNTDPTSIARIVVIINNQPAFYSFDQLVNISLKIGIAFIQTGFSGGNHMEVHHKISNIPNYALVKPIATGSFLSLEMEDNKPKNNFSILDCLYRAIENRGLKPEISHLENVGINSFGYSLNAIIVNSKN